MRKAEASFEAASLPFRLMLFCDWWQGLIAQPTTASSSLLQMRNGVQLVTADRQILQEFPEVAISLDKFVRD